MPAGYSKRPLVDKLGIRPGSRLLLVDAPDGYDRTLGPLPPGATRASRAGPGLDVVHAFVTRRSELERRLPAWRKAVFPDGAVWISWPKKAAKLPTDLTEDVIRAVALAGGLVDVKVCAVDDVWSGLKLVVPVAQREP